MDKPKDYDQIPEYRQRKELPAGGYVCEIKNAKETKSSTGRDMLVLAFEITEGDYKGYFFEEYTRTKENKPDANWPYEGRKWILTENEDGSTNPLIKGLVTSIEAENVKVKWGKEFCQSIQGAQLGVVFGREEHEYNGVQYWRTTPRYFCSCEDVRTENYNIPKERPLKTPGVSIQDVADPGDSFQAVEDDLPWT